ncbi:MULTISPECIES: response regulator [unclassified Lentimicrobium]|uniref:glycoside hydrolase family 130 protein n=1 Tax=unclassified Lentimicrobium TaxID=2677434 RepID=UPI0015526AC6|nr:MULTISPECIES: response regulator [unclassified Lentimicrobium]NPD45348.1 response regulator [Lentimicrobium sp. S6]NPD84353.1 response regulator [Lentimicrobium sp. L6]
MSTTINRKPVRFYSDPKRVIVRFFFPGGEPRVQSIIQKVIDMPEEAAKLSLNQSLRNFSGRHRNISKIFLKHFNRTKDIMKDRNGDLNILSDAKKLLIGAFFTSEYSIESAAFFNPSMVEDPDQTGLQEGQKRVIISFRATGEGHISAIVFRGGILDKDNNLELIPTGRLIDEAEKVKNHIYTKDIFRQKLCEIHGFCSADLSEGINNKYFNKFGYIDLDEQDQVVSTVLNKLGDHFDYHEMDRALEETHHELQADASQLNILQTIRWLAKSHYEIIFSLDTGISDRVIFPIAASESNGIEDARFVKFTDDKGTVRYYATYTAYNGRSIMPKLIETKDFYKFKIMPIHGENAQNKGMALFPRKINGKYVMLSRIDGVNNYIMYSDDINLWGEALKIHSPKYPWEFIQVGNCGSPIETDYGWLVLTHGVGVMRKYVMGALLLDLDDPTKIIGQLSEPLLSPNEEEREGYVPNVVYSCGSIVNNDELVIPYAMSDTSSTYATVSLQELLTSLVPSDLKKGRTNQVKAKARVLIVEDEVIYQKMLAVILKSEGYEVEIAPDGIVALMKIGKEPFDVILSDIAMPNLDGYQMLDYMNKHNYNTPVIFLSGYTSIADEIKGIGLGAVDYIKKPIDKSVLLTRLEKILNL